jgi:hypothetical protein
MCESAFKVSKYCSKYFAICRILKVAQINVSTLRRSVVNRFVLHRNGGNSFDASLRFLRAFNYPRKAPIRFISTSLTLTNPTFCPHSVFICFVWIWEQTAIISLYNINWLVCITETGCVYCAVRAGSLISLITPSMLHSHGSRGQSPTSHCGEPGSIPGKSMWD